MDVINAEIECRLCFFFSSRRRHTRFDCDWSSNVCSSDLDVIDTGIQSGYGSPPAVVGFLPQMANSRKEIEIDFQKIGRASCRERVQISVVAVSLKKKRVRVGRRVGLINRRYRGRYWHAGQ